MYFVFYFSWSLLFVFLVCVFDDQEDHHFVHYFVRHYEESLAIHCIINSSQLIDKTGHTLLLGGSSSFVCQYEG